MGFVDPEATPSTLSPNAGRVTQCGTSGKRVHDDSANDERKKAALSSLLPAAAVDGLADDVSVASVPRGLLNHVNRNPPQVSSHLSPCARHVEINGSEDFLRSSDSFSVVRDNSFDGVVVGDPKPVLVLWRHLGHSPRSCARRRRPGTSGAPRLPSVVPSSVGTANSQSAHVWRLRQRLHAASRSVLHAACRETRTGLPVQSRRTPVQNAPMRSARHLSLAQAERRGPGASKGRDGSTWSKVLSSAAQHRALTPPVIVVNRQRYWIPPTNPNSERTGGVLKVLVPQAEPISCEQSSWNEEQRSDYDDNSGDEVCHGAAKAAKAANSSMKAPKRIWFLATR